jgi:hypothetical protein
MATLTETLADQVRDALLRHADAIEGGLGVVRTLHVEVAVGRAGQAAGATFYVEHHLSPGELVGLAGRAKRHT